MKYSTVLARAKNVTGRILSFFWLAVLVVPSASFADLNIDLGELNPAPTATPGPQVTPTARLEIETPTPAPKPTESLMGEPSPALPSQTPQAFAPTPIVAHGFLKMKDYYDAGMKSYKTKDYDEAIRYLEKALTLQDAYTPKYYYSEANAILGVIYQFHIIRLGKAYRYYKAALKIDPMTPTAKRHIKEVYPYRHQKDEK